MIRAFTWNNWHFIAVVHPNRVVFLKEKATGDWKRRQHIISKYGNYNPIEDPLNLDIPRRDVEQWKNLPKYGEVDEDVADSLWNEKFTETNDCGWIELPEAEATALWEECKNCLSISEEIVPTSVTY